MLPGNFTPRSAVGADPVNGKPGQPIRNSVACFTELSLGFVVLSAHTPAADPESSGS